MKAISKNKQEKMQTVEALKEKIDRTRSLFLADYQGLTHKQLEELRKKLKKAEGEILVAKNRLVNIAIKETKNASFSAKETIEHLEKALENPTAAILSYGDEIAPIKVVADFIKSSQLPKIKAGMFGGKPATEQDFQKISQLPSKEVLLATLAARLKGPISGLHYAMQWNLRKLVTALDNVKSKKTS